MAFELFEHKADIGIKGISETIEHAFEEGAKALFQIMTEIKLVGSFMEKLLEVNAVDKETLFVEFLNELLYLSDKNQMFFSKFRVKIEEKETEWILTGNAFGEKINPKKHKIKTEVKAASYSQLKVEKENGNWIAQCIVDV